MNAITRISRTSRSFAIVLLAVAGGCHVPGYFQRTSSPVTAATAPPPLGALGTSLEDIDARNRANIEAQLGRPVAPGPATPAEVVAMTHAGVNPRFIICYINRSTNPVPVGAQDVIYMHEQGVDEQVIQAMLTPGSANSRAEIARSMPPRVLILSDPWWPYYYPCYPYYGAGIGFGHRFY
jgi:hypothetical protein